MKSKIFMSMLVIVVALSLVVGGTMAWFTDTETSNANTFTTGTLNVDINRGVDYIDLGTVSNVAPGDVMKMPATILIENTGNINLAWFGKFNFVGDDAMKDLIYVDNMKMEFLTPNGADWNVNYSPDEFILNGNGSGAYPSAFIALAGGDHKISLRELMGNNTMNAFGYENMGALKPGYYYRLTFKLGLLGEETTNAFMNKSVNLSYQIDATQINEAALNKLIPGAGIHSGWFTDQIAAQQ